MSSDGIAIYSGSIGVTVELLYFLSQHQWPIIVLLQILQGMKMTAHILFLHATLQNIEHALYDCDEAEQCLPLFSRSSKNVDSKVISHCMQFWIATFVSRSIMVYRALLHFMMLRWRYEYVGLLSFDVPKYNNFLKHLKQIWI